ncbi:hypothetical protein N5D61_05405 [Pseudomonas sp. GD03842]|uniref:hypothetical protein n=1 Tax=Pseudomonas sp. GD03842 TaxID=2975385 RepID=UPI002448A3B6|nr:hypothetical protein [Pseudomonas sp. GD03842]MDH0745775.1 hypothetical protein [Pseudomonas sp. GD03842]
MSNYTLQLSPATYSAAAGALVLATILAAQAKAEAMDSVDLPAKPSTMAVGHYREFGSSPTIGVNVGDAVAYGAFDASRYLDDASQAFVAQMSLGMQPLGAEFAAVLEDHFWDLVLG